MKQCIKSALTNLKTDLDNIIESDENMSKLEQLAKIFRRSMDNKYRIFYTGVGKTSYAAHKLAATAKSIGLRSEFLDSQNAGHGDIGAISKHKASYCLYLSKSGKTVEHFVMSRLIARLRPTCTNVMICFSDDEYASTINLKEHGIHQVINLPIDILESDSLGILPTNSNALFEACISGAMISAGLQDKLGMFEALACNHPSGSLHSKVTNCIAELMKADGVTEEQDYAVQNVKALSV